MNKIIKHIGAGPIRIPEMENTDKDQFNIILGSDWEKVADDSVDAFVAHHVFQEIEWRQLVGVFKQIYRTLKPGGVLRFGVPHIDSRLGVEYLLHWGNINLFSDELLAKVLVELGFEVKRAEYGKTHSDIDIIVKADNRPDESLYLEAFK